jgi:hypothetical protein
VAGVKTKPVTAGTAPAEGGASARPAANATAAATAEPSWIRDFIGAQQFAVGFGGDLARQRQALRTPLMVVVLTWIGFQWFGLAVAVPAAVTAIGAAVGLALLADGYRQDPSVQAQWREQRGLREVEAQVRRANRRLQSVQNKLERAERKLEKRRVRLETQRQESQGKEKEALARHDQRLQEKLADAQRRRDQLQQAGVDAVRRLEAKHAAYLAGLDKRIAISRQEEERELKETLARRSQQFVAAYMKRQTIDAAVIPGIGLSVKQTLRKHGIVRAEDIDARRLAQVEGIGEVRARTLLEWRRKAEALAAQAAPQSLSKVEETLIRTRYFGRRFSLEQEKGKAQRKLAKDVAEARERNAQQLKVADEEPNKLRAESAQKRDEVRKRFQQQRDDVKAALKELAKEGTGEKATLDQDAATIQQELSQLEVQRSRVEYRLRRYEGLHFGAYVQRVVLGE